MIVIQRLNEDTEYQEVGRIQDGEIVQGEDNLLALDEREVWEESSEARLLDLFSGPYVMAGYVEESDDLTKDWVPYQGPRGGEGWQNTETGEVRYQDDPPSDSDINSPTGEQAITSPEETNERSGQDESIAEIDRLVTEMKEGDTAGFEVRRKMGDTARDATGIGDVSIRVYNKPDLAGKITKDLIKFSQQKDLSELDEFSVKEGRITDELKGLGGIASGVYLSNNFSEEIIINHSNYSQEQVDEWNEDGYSKALTNPESVIKHEFGHYFHEMNTQPKNEDANMNWEERPEPEVIDEEMWEQFISELGKYAGTNITEFVAEAFTYQMNGNELSDELRELYERFDGPEVPQ